MMMAFAVLKFVIFLSLYSSVFCVTERSVADKYGTGNGCPVCPKDKVCAGPADNKVCVYPKAIGKQCGKDPFSVCDKGSTCKNHICAQSFVSLGMECTSEGSKCEPGTTCVGPVHLKLCVKKVKRGTSCDHTLYSVCEPGLTCVKNICMEKIPRGGDCLFQGAMCAEGAVCAGTAEKKECVKPKSVGKKCGQDPFWVCEADLTCEEGFCKVPKGKDCKPKGSVCVDGSVCTGTDTRKKCVAPKELRKPCGQDAFSVCRKELVCEGGFCKNPKGGDCTARNSVCVDDTTCAGNDMEKKCVTPVDLRKKCGQNPFAVCKEGLVCEEGFCKIPNRGNCAVENPLCVDDTVCAGNDMNKKCVTPVDLRKKCGQNSFAVCKEGLVCEEGFCKIPNRGNCDVENPLCVDDTVCAGNDMNRKCVTPVDLRKKCGQNPFAVCKEGLVCEEGFCKIPNRGNCDVDNPLCVDDTVCAGNDMNKKCVTPVDLRKKCGQNPFAVCKESLVCEEGFCKIPNRGNCAVENPLCVDDTVCAGNDMNKKCVTPVDLRKKCGQNPFAVCKEGLVCEEGFCKIPNRGNCDVDNPLCVDDTVCAGNDMNKKCVTPVDLRKKCGQNPFAVCKESLVCEEGFCKIPMGGDCAVNNFLCVDDAICIGTDNIKRCVRPKDVRMPCGQNPFSVCKSDLVCEEGFCKVPKDGDCNSKNSLCVDNTACVGSIRKRKCKMLKGMGQPCGNDPYSVCQTGLRCVHGFCRKPIPVGGSCLKPGSKCDRGSICAGTRKKKVCVKPRSIGQGCGRDPFWVCQPGLHCIHGMCKLKIPHGGKCGRKGSVCTHGMVCAGTSHTKRCVKPRSSGYRCGKNPFMVCRKGLKCQKGSCRLPKGSRCWFKNALCEEGTVCAGSHGRKRCTVRTGCGKHCRSSHGCHRGLTCEKGVCKIPVGRRCSSNGSICVYGSVCAGHGVNKKCVVLKGRGQRCGSGQLSMCKRGLKCEQGVCKVRIGGNCKPIRSVCVQGYVCAGNHNNRRCVKQRGRGARCGYHSWVCKEGLRCVHGICQKARVVGLGVDCRSSDCVCGQGLVCAWKHGRKVCVRKV